MLHFLFLSPRVLLFRRLRVHLFPPCSCLLVRPSSRLHWSPLDSLRCWMGSRDNRITRKKALALTSVEMSVRARRTAVLFGSVVVICVYAPDSAQDESQRHTEEVYEDVEEDDRGAGKKDQDVHVSWRWIFHDSKQGPRWRMRELLDQKTQS